MKRAILTLVLVLLAFVLGWICACIRVQTLACDEVASNKAEQARIIAALRQQIYGNNYFHSKYISPEDDARLRRFNPSSSKGMITLSYVGGLGGADTQMQIHGDGNFFITAHGVSRKVGTLDRDRCVDFFMGVIKSGILNYSDDVIELKRDLARPDSMTSRNDAATKEFRIHVPELDIDKVFSIDAEVELRNFPDIIEYQLASALEKEILSFVPKDDPFWGPPAK